MAELIAKSPCDGMLPVWIGDLSVTEETFDALTSVAAFRGQDAALSAALKKAHGMAAPAPNRTTGKAGARALWFARGQFLLMGPDPSRELAGLAALTDQSDAWAVVRLEGAGAEEVLARLVPVDLRAATFKRGHTARTLVMHMAASVTRVGDQAFQILVFRSMAATLVHDLKTAMEAVSAQG